MDPGVGSHHTASWYMGIHVAVEITQNMYAITSTIDTVTGQCGTYSSDVSKSRNKRGSESAPLLFYLLTSTTLTYILDVRGSKWEIDPGQSEYIQESQNSSPCITYKDLCVLPTHLFYLERRERSEERP